MESGASSVIIAACSVALILDSLFLVAWLKEGCNELKVVKMGVTGLWVANQECPRDPAWQVPKGLMDLAIIGDYTDLG